MNRGVKVVVMQIPLQDITPLKNMIRFRREAIFVSNELNFKEAIHNTCLKAYILDYWSHTSVAGNILMAENLAHVIKEKLFSSNRF